MLTPLDKIFMDIIKNPDSKFQRDVISNYEDGTRIEKNIYYSQRMLTTFTNVNDMNFKDVKFISDEFIEQLKKQYTNEMHES